MEYAKDKIFQIKYNTNLNELHIGKKGKRRKICNTIKRNKLLATCVITFFIFSIINIIMICNFLKLLENL